MNQKTALITGASRGIGKACACLFAERGYDLILTCLHNEEMLHALSEKLEADCAIRCRTFTGDLSDDTQAERLFDGLASLDVLLHNAGTAYSGLIQDMPVADWHRVIDTNLSSAFYLARRAIPLMLPKKAGKIIFISSVWGEAGASMEAAYCASKGGLNSFTKALARELGPSGISVNAIACGLMDTDMNGHLSEDELSALIDEIPACRMGRPDEAAALALDLAEGHPYLTGQIITLDGGWM